MKELLAKLDKPGPSPEELASLRAVEVLEYIGTSEAKKLLKTWAAAQSDNRLREESAAAVKRLRRSNR